MIGTETFLRTIERSEDGSFETFTKKLPHKLFPKVYDETLLKFLEVLK